MSWLKKLGSFFAALFSPATAQAILSGIRKAAPYVDVALQLSTMAAGALGPQGKTVATVLGLADKFGVQAFIKPDATDAELGTAIRDTIAAALKQKFPDASAADLNRAIEIAYGAVKG
jgi:hypothetical protein